MLPALRARFPNRAFVLGRAPTEIATFPAAHPGFGDLVIHDDAHEATIVLGTLMHTHIGSHYSTRTPEERDRAVVEDVLEFLNDLFEDRIVVWCVPGKSGGYYYIGRKSARVPQTATMFVWSGPHSG